MVRFSHNSFPAFFFIIIALCITPTSPPKTFPFVDIVFFSQFKKLTCFFFVRFWCSIVCLFDSHIVWSNHLAITKLVRGWKNSTNFIKWPVSFFATTLLNRTFKKHHTTWWCGLHDFLGFKLYNTLQSNANAFNFVS